MQTDLVGRLLHYHGDKNPSLEELGRITAGWALAHGFAMLYIDGRLKRIFNQAPPGTGPLDLLDVTFASVARGAPRSLSIKVRKPADT